MGKVWSIAASAWLWAVLLLLSGAACLVLGALALAGAWLALLVAGALCLVAAGYLIRGVASHG